MGSRPSRGGPLTGPRGTDHETVKICRNSTVGIYCFVTFQTDIDIRIRAGAKPFFALTGHPPSFLSGRISASYDTA